MTLRPVIQADEATRRLELIFPRAAFDTVLSNPLAGAAVAAMIYVNAVAEPNGDLGPDGVWARPSTCTWMSNAALRHDGDDERRAWRTAATRSKTAVTAVQTGWGEAFEQRYADNTRETLRDETFKHWLDLGALLRRAGVATSSSSPRWALTSSFADLFDPHLSNAQVTTAVDAWVATHMNPSARVRTMLAADMLKQQHEVLVDIPGGGQRSLEPGTASLILKGVIEQWAPRRLRQPWVVTISEPGDKIFTGDAQTLRRLGLHIDVNRVLPDALLVDVGVEPVMFWIIEAVATDGPIDEARRRVLLDWAEEQNIPRTSCSFLTAFISRAAAPARRRLKDLAVGTYAWYADEPERELAWYEMPS